MRREKFSGSVLFTLFAGLLISLNTLSAYGSYDDTYKLAVKQKYAIPENIEKSDYVGVWLKTWTWKSKGAITFGIERNFHDAFAINPTTGLITVNNAARINGKIVRQDTIINLIIRTNDAGIGFELDTAQIFIKENSFCKFIDYSYTGTESGSKVNPNNDLDDLAFKPGFGYFIKRGTTIRDEYTTITGHIASELHPTLFAAYGKGNKPKFTSGTNICFYIGDTSGGSGDPVTTRCEYVYFFDLHIRDYASSAFYCRRKSDHIGWYNMDIRNCDKKDVESTLVINTSNYGDSATVFGFEILNCTFDTTSITCTSGCEKNFIKIGVGKALVTNCFFGSITGVSQPLRLTSGQGSIVRHCLFKPGSYSGTAETAANIQVRQDKVLIEDCIFNKLANGVYITNPGTVGGEIQPDAVTVRNCLFTGQSLNGIMVRPANVSDHPGVGHVFEDNLMENVANGIELRDCRNTTIRRNKIVGGSGSGIYTGGGEQSIGTTISYNVIYGFGGDEIKISLGSKTNIYNNMINGSINCTGSSIEKAYNNYANSFVSVETAANNIDIDTIEVSRHFVNFAGRDFILKATATSAINKGRDLGLISDFTGNMISGLPEIGAFEHGATTSLSTDIPPAVENQPPVILDQEFIVRQKDFNNRYVGKVIAYDNNTEQKINYTIVSGNDEGLFELNSQTGDLSTLRTDVFQEVPYTCELTLNVTDNCSNPASQVASIMVTFIGKSKTVHINPKNIADPEEDGSLDHPYDSWLDISWEPGNEYLQKKGTSAVVDKIVIGADNVLLGAYGEGELPVIYSETNAYLIVGFERKSITINNLHLQGPNAVSCLYFLGNTSDNIVVDHCKLEGVSNAIRLVDGQKFTVRYNSISGGEEGVLSSAGVTDVYYNVFKNNRVAVNITTPDAKANIFNNVFVGNGESVSASYGELTLFNNIFYLTAAGQKAIKNLSEKVTADHNIYYPEQEGFIEIADNRYNTLDELQQNLRIDLKSFNSDPSFMDLYKDNFELKNNSPAIDAGINLNLTSDFFGENVPKSNLPDIGICEYTGGLKNLFSRESGPELSVYPNPSSGYINIDIKIDEAAAEAENSAGSKESSIQVVNLAGKILLTKIVEGASYAIHDNIDLSTLSNGIYFVICEVFGERVTEKLVLNR
jgi:hypothetical protein